MAISILGFELLWDLYSSVEAIVGLAVVDTDTDIWSVLAAEDVDLLLLLLLVDVADLTSPPLSMTTSVDSALLPVVVSIVEVVGGFFVCVLERMRRLARYTDQEWIRR